MNQKKHILFLAEWFPNPTDPQLGIFIEKHARAAAMNFDVTVLFIYTDENSPQKISIDTENKEYKLVRVSYNSPENKIIRLLRYMRAFKLGLRECGKPDIVHLHICGRNAFSRKLFLPLIPYVISEHWSGYLKEGKNFLIGESLTKKTFRNAIAVSVPNEILKNALLKKLHLDNAVIIPNVIEESDLPLNKPAVKRIIVVADLIDEIKNISGILEALKTVRHTERFDVVIIGDGPDRETIQKKANSINNPKINVDFIGRKSNDIVLAELKNSSFLVVNSRFETFSMITAEALLAGIPVIATKCGGPELLINEDNGILIEVDDVSALSKAIQRMLNEHNHYEPAILRKEIKDKYGMETIAAKLKEFYSKVI